jgi:anti-anti-sigma factor
MTDDRKAAHVPRRLRPAPSGGLSTTFRCAAGASDSDRPADLRISMTAADDHLVVAEVAGEIDLRTVDQLRAGLLALVETGFRNIIVDFEHVRFCDATGLGALVAVHNRLAERQGAVRLAGVRPAQRKLFRITGLDRVLRIHDSVADGRGGLTRAS